MGQELTKMVGDDRIFGAAFFCFVFLRGLSYFGGTLLQFFQRRFDLGGRLLLKKILYFDFFLRGGGSGGVAFFPFWGGGS